MLKSSKQLIWKLILVFFLEFVIFSINLLCFSCVYFLVKQNVVSRRNQMILQRNKKRKNMLGTVKVTAGVVIVAIVVVEEKEVNIRFFK